MNYVVYQDLVVGTSDGNAAHIVSGITENDISLLRFDGTDIVYGSASSSFFIDDRGVKHIIQHDGGWQALTVGFTLEIIKDAGTWRMKLPGDFDAEIIEKAERDIDRITDSWDTISASRTRIQKEMLKISLGYEAAGFPGTVPAKYQKYLVAIATNESITEQVVAQRIIDREDAKTTLFDQSEPLREQVSIDVAAAVTVNAKAVAALALVNAVKALN